MHDVASVMYLTTRTGFQFYVRSADPDDRETLENFFEGVTADDLRFRFLTAVEAVAPSQISRLTHPDRHHVESFIAFTEDGALMIASGMLACDASFEHGEVAIAIRADHKGKGIGWEFLALLTKFADEKGVRIVESIESRDNHEAIDLERNMGFAATPYPGDPTLMLLSRRAGDQR